MPAIACVLTLSASCLLLLTANQAKLVMVLLNVKTCKQEGAAGGGGFDTGRGCLAAEGISLAQQPIQGTVLLSPHRCPTSRASRHCQALVLPKSKEGEKLLPSRPGWSAIARASNLRRPPDTHMAAPLQAAFPCRKDCIETAGARNPQQGRAGKSCCRRRCRQPAPAAAGAAQGSTCRTCLCPLPRVACVLLCV